MDKNRKAITYLFEMSYFHPIQKLTIIGFSASGNVDLIVGRIPLQHPQYGGCVWTALSKNIVWNRGSCELETI